MSLNEAFESKNIYRHNEIWRDILSKGHNHQLI